MPAEGKGDLDCETTGFTWLRCFILSLFCIAVRSNCGTYDKRLIVRLLRGRARVRSGGQRSLCDCVVLCFVLRWHWWEGKGMRFEGACPAGRPRR